MRDLTPRERRRLDRLRKMLRRKPSAAVDELLIAAARDMTPNRERMEPETVTPAQVKFYQALALVASENKGKP